MIPARYEGARVLVTGAARGIGWAVAARFVAEGAHVVVADRDAVAAKTAADALTETGGSAESLEIDVSDPEAMHAAAGPLTRLDVVVANAGIQRFAPVSDLEVADWDRVLQINARGALFTLQLAARAVVDRGAVVTITSIQAHLPNTLSADYSASKAAVLSLTRTFASELAARGIRVNSVAPGRIDTELSDYASREVGRITGDSAEATLRQRIAANPLGRAGTPADVADAVTYLASADASYITGECLNVCGGDVMMP